MIDNTDSKEKTVYLLGAGASANTLPVAAEMPDDMIKIAEKFAQNFPEENGVISEGIRNLGEKSKGYGTVDQYAYTLRESEKYFESEGYMALRLNLTNYMLLRQLYSAPGLDDRYQMWLKSICAPTISFDHSYDEAKQRVEVKSEHSFVPQHICALTYNYDCQMEIAFYKHYLANLVGAHFFSPEAAWYIQEFHTPTYNTYNNALKMPLSFFGFYPSNIVSVAGGMVESLPTIGFDAEIKGIVLTRTFHITRWSCIHLNGICDSAAHCKTPWGPGHQTPVREMMRAWRQFQLLGTFRDPDKEKYIIDFVKFAKEQIHQHSSAKPCWNQFAWDLFQVPELGGKQADYVAKKVAGAKNLVVVGYSFPEFNRWMDQGIFDGLKNGGALERIYIQNPNPHIPDIFRQKVSGAKVIEITDTEEFYIPDSIRD